MKIAVISGDGIGPEVTKQALKVLDAVSKKYNFSYEVEEVLMGGTAIDKTGIPLPEETVNVCLNSDAVLLGAVGGVKWDTLPGHLRPEAGLLGLRKALGVFANLRPAILFPQLKSASTLKEEVLGDGLDIMVIRELIGGAYFGEKKRIETEEGTKAWDTMMYSAHEIERISHVAFKAAMKRKNKLTLVDKANVLESSRLWREIVFKIAKEYPEVDLSTMYVDNAAMQLIRNPRQFDLILTENLFGDILSDEASMLTGSLGMLPSASLGEGKRGLYEPIHGSAPDIAGQDKANPVAAILSVAMMLRYSFDMEEAANSIEVAVSKVLDEGYRTLDIHEIETKIVGTEMMGDLIAERI
ncbi:3-isopropylmalate dehydrogenase [Clostridium sp. SYSU_GA19001]|uniref:3-isopropylmalate dehydrogenase n=1 Tax=Clostridium caldaquaticum TaxID=2940653 RepID=UPI0020775C11|nr:3-isopropylmalate dehydrogenase [Clostridium caldaquaticum]MCM8710906.1 3-isopropylmalate dehydrogenase [Clostridium caldaquaticum]